MRARNFLLLSAMVIAVMVFFTYQEAGAVADGNGSCSLVELDRFDCDQFGTPVIEFLNTISTTCTTSISTNFPCKKYNYKYTGSTQNNPLIDVAIPVGLMKNWPQIGMQTLLSDANAAGCSILFVNGKGDSSTAWNEGNLLTNTCRVKLTNVTGGATFFVAAELSDPGPLAWFVQTGNTPGPGIINGPAAAQAPIFQSAGTVTAGTASVSYTLTPGQAPVITGGSGTVLPLSRTKLCLPATTGQIVSFNTDIAWHCETISSVTEQCDVVTTGNDPCRFVGGSCIKFP